MAAQRRATLSPPRWHAHRPPAYIYERDAQHPRVAARSVTTHAKAVQDSRPAQWRKKIELTHTAVRVFTSSHRHAPPLHAHVDIHEREKLFRAATTRWPLFNRRSSRCDYARLIR